MADERPELTAERIDKLRAMLREGDRCARAAAMHEAALAHAVAAPLVPDIAMFLTSEDYVRVSEQEYSFSGHSPLATAARSAIEAIGTAPDLATLRRLLADRTVMLLPEASYDQGAYIGDYSSEEIAPAALAAQLVALTAQRGFALLPELSQAARAEPALIREAAVLAIERLTKLVPAARPLDFSAMTKFVDDLAGYPETAEASERGYILRKLLERCRKKLGIAR